MSGRMEREDRSLYAWSVDAATATASTFSALRGGSAMILTKISFKGSHGFLNIFSGAKVAHPHIFICQAGIQNGSRELGRSRAFLNGQFRLREAKIGKKLTTFHCAVN